MGEPASNIPAKIDPIWFIGARKPISLPISRGSEFKAARWGFRAGCDQKPLNQWTACDRTTTHTCVTIHNSSSVFSDHSFSLLWLLPENFWGFGCSLIFFQQDQFNSFLLITRMKYVEKSDDFCNSHDDVARFPFSAGIYEHPIVT